MKLIHPSIITTIFWPTVLNKYGKERVDSYNRLMYGYASLTTEARRHWLTAEQDFCISLTLREKYYDGNT